MAGVRTFVVANAEAFHGSPPDPGLLETALSRVFGQRGDEAPRPVGGNKPPV